MAKEMALYGLQHWRARVAGQVTQLEEWNQRNFAAIEKLHQRITANEQKIAALKSLLDVANETALSAFGSQLPVPIPRKTYPKNHFISWGGITRSTISALVEARGVAMTTSQIAMLINQSLNLNLDPTKMRMLQDSIGDALRTMLKKGIVERAKKADAPGKFASWVIKVTDE